MNLASQGAIEDILATHEVVVFGKGKKGSPFCGFTARVQIVFEDLDCDYHMVNVLEDPQMRADLKTFSDWPTFPQIYVKKEFIGGCDIVEAMAEDGSLAKMLGQS